MKPIFFFLLFLFCIKSYSQKTLVFFGSFNRDKTDEGIYIYELNTINGKLSKKSSVRGILNPSFLALSPHGDYLFSCTESKTKNAGSVNSFKIDSEKGKISLINNQKSGGENPVYLSVHKNGKWLINGNYTEGSISVYKISENGEIFPFSQNLHFEEGSINPDKQDRSHIHSTVFSPNSDYVFAPDLGSDKIRVFKFDENSDEPLKNFEKQFPKVTLGSGPRHFIFHPEGKFAYCIEEMGGTISSYKYENGNLELVQRINAHSEKYKTDFESSDIHISPDGKFLYASNRGFENNIAIFKRTSIGVLLHFYYALVVKTKSRFLNNSALKNHFKCKPACGKFAGTARR